jgi:hypothetical protein
MVERMQQHWREFRESNPGRRLEQPYRHRITIIYVGFPLLFGNALF